MLYYLFKMLEHTGFPGARLMDYITLRSGAALLSLIHISEHTRPLYIKYAVFCLIKK